MLHPASQRQASVDPLRKAIRPRPPPCSICLLLGLPATTMSHVPAAQTYSGGCRLRGPVIHPEDYEVSFERPGCYINSSDCPAVGTASRQLGRTVCKQLYRRSITGSPGHESIGHEVIGLESPGACRATLWHTSSPEISSGPPGVVPGAVCRAEHTGQPWTSYHKQTW